MRNTYLIVGIVVVILVTVTFAIVRNRLPQFGQIGRAAPTPTPTTAVEERKDTISVSAHTPAKTAVIDKVTLGKSGFIIIHESQNGQIGGILGASGLLKEGTHENIVIELTRKTVDRENLFAMIHTDNGDGNFDPSIDESAKEESGATLQATLQVSKDSGSGFQAPATGLGEDAGPVSDSEESPTWREGL